MKGGPQLCPCGDLIQMMTMKKNIAFTFLFGFIDQEIYPGSVTYPENYFGI